MSWQLGMCLLFGGLFLASALTVGVLTWLNARKQYRDYIRGTDLDPNYRTRQFTVGRDAK